MLQRSFISKSVLLVFIFILGVPLLSFSQGELTWFDGKYKKLLPLVDAVEYHNEIYTLNAHFSKSTVLVEKRTMNLALQKEAKYKFKVDKYKPSVYKFLKFNDRLYVLSVEKLKLTSANYQIFINEFNIEDLSIGKTIFECTSSIKSPIVEDFNIVSAISPNGKFFVLTCIEKKKRKEAPVVDTYIFDGNFKKLHQYKSKIEVIDNNPQIKKVQIDDEANVFFMTIENVKRKISYVNAILININNNLERQTKINLKNSTVLRDADFTISKDDIYITGLYSEQQIKDKKEKNPVRGAFFIKKKKKGKAKASPTYHPFSKKTMHASLKKSLQKKLKAKGKIQEIENLHIKETSLWGNNRILTVAEVFFKKDISSQTSSDLQLIHKDIIVLSFNLKGELIWENNILKKTTQKVDGTGYKIKSSLYGSYFMDKKDEKITFYYYIPATTLASTVHGYWGEKEKLKKETIFGTTMNFQTGKIKNNIIAELDNNKIHQRRDIQIAPHKWFLSSFYFFFKYKYGVLNTE